MSWHYTLFSIPLFLSTALLIAMMVVSWQHRAVPGVLYLFWASLTQVLYVFGYGMELGSETLAQMQFWLQVEYIGVTLAPVMITGLVFIFTQQGHRITALTQALALAIPLITLGLAWTNPHHELIWQGLHLNRVGSLAIAEFTPGPWYWVSAGYFWIQVLVCLALLLKALRRSYGLYRRQTILMLAGLLLPLPVHAIYLSGILPYHLDINAAGSVATALFFAWGLFHSHLLEVMPVARMAVLMAMDDAVIVLNRSSRVIFLNPEAQSLIGPDAKDLIGQPASVAFQRWPALMDHYQNLRETAEQICMDMADGGRCYDLRISSLHNDRQKWAGRVIVLRDVTQRVEAQQALSRANEHLRLLRRIDREMTSRLDVDHVVRIALDTTTRMSRADGALIALVEEHGLRVVGTLGRYTSEQVSLIPASEQGITRRALRDRQPERVLDVARDPDYLPLIPGIRAQMSIPLVSNTRLIGVLTLETCYPERFDDDVYAFVTLLAGHLAIAIDNALIYEDRQRLVDELGAYAYTVAHDLKNPVSTVMGYASMLLAYGSDMPEDERSQDLARILNMAHKMNSIIESLLLLAETRSSKEIAVRRVDMGAVVRDVCERLHASIEQYHAEIVMPDVWPVILTHPAWVEEIWANYLSNAIKYGGRPPRIELGYDSAEGQTRFWVQDNGPGLSPEAQAELFKPFTRLKHHTQEEGSGLGLSIVQRITARLGGAAGVESEIGGGSRFTFSLPDAGEMQVQGAAHGLEAAQTAGL